jgi:hypothetical protein
MAPLETKRGEEKRAYPKSGILSLAMPCVIPKISWLEVLRLLSE